MLYAIYLTCFGLISGLSLFLGVAWARLAIKRAIRFRSCRVRRKDRYLVLATALSFQSIGMVLIFATRIYTELRGVHAAVFSRIDGALLAIGMTMVSISMYGYLWALEVDRKDWGWQSGLFFGVAWTLFSCWWIFYGAHVH